MSRDRREDTGAYYPGGTVIPVAPQQRTTQVPVTDVGDLGDRYTLADVKAKVNQVVQVLAQRTSALAAPLALASLLVWPVGHCAGGVEIKTARLDALYNDSLVVTNVTGTSGVDTNAVREIVKTNVAEWAWAGKAEPQGMTTNAVREIASSATVTNKGAVAAAKAFDESRLSVYNGDAEESDTPYIKWNGKKLEIGNTTDSCLLTLDALSGYTIIGYNIASLLPFDWIKDSRTKKSLYDYLSSYTNGGAKAYTDSATNGLASAVSSLSSRVSGLASSKRDLTNNVCVADSFGAPFGPWSRDNLPSDVTWNAQPVYDESIDLWEWAYNGGSAQSEEGGADATSLTFGYGEGFTSTRTAAKIATSNDTFVTHTFVTNAIATLAPAPDFSTNNTALVSTITNVAGKAGGGTAQGINLHDAGLGCDWQLSVSNSVFTWTVKED